MDEIGIVIVIGCGKCIRMLRVCDIDWIVEFIKVICNDG